MKLWLVSAGWNYEGEYVLAVCTSLELAEKAQAIIEAEDRGYDYYEITEVETDVFDIFERGDGHRFISKLGDGGYIPILEYQKDEAV